MNKTLNNHILKFNGFSSIRLLLLTFLLSSYSINFNSTTAQDKFVVVLDAGHGGHDPGNLGNGYLEKNIALNIVLKAGELLSKNPNIKVIYTRKDDTFVDLFERGEIANKANADLFVSVHCDSHTSDAHGAGTFVLGLHANKQNFEIAKKENSVIYLEDNYQAKYSEYNIDSPESVIGLTIMQEEFLDQSIALAKLLQGKFSNKLRRTDRKVKQAGFIVLHQTFMPSVLVEAGFLTNKSEGAYLNSKPGQLEMGTAIAESVVAYMEQLVANTLATSSSTPEPQLKDEVVPVIVKKEAEKEIEKDIVTTKKPAIKEPEMVKKAQEEVQKLTASTTNSNIEFRVQLFASGKSIPLKPENFKGLNALTKEPVNNLYRYMTGKAKTYYDAKLIKSNADIKGYTSSYIVAYKEGKRINVEDAIKQLKE